jgi:hypothetical protein
MEMVGTGRFELPTCRLGGGRSIHLSYVPIPNYILILNHFEFQLILLIIFLAPKRIRTVSKPPYPAFAVSKPFSSSLAWRLSFSSASRFIWSFIWEYFLNTAESP